MDAHAVAGQIFPFEDRYATLGEFQWEDRSFATGTGTGRVCVRLYCGVCSQRAKSRVAWDK